MQNISPCTPHGTSPSHYGRRSRKKLTRMESLGVISKVEKPSIKSAGGTLNKDKCEFSKETLTFWGYIVGKQGESSDPEKTRAIVEMEEPKNLKELRGFVGMANQLGKFSPNLAELSQPLRELLSPKKAWVWDQRRKQHSKK